MITFTRQLPKGLCGVILLPLVLSACQSSPQPRYPAPQVIYQPRVAQPAPRYQGNVRFPQVSRQQPPAMTLPIVRSQDGLQDMRWTISSVNGRAAQFFVQSPYLLLQSSSKRLMGNTGCNAIRGSYQLNGQQISIQAEADHQPCDNALAQEADVMDALSRVKSLRVSNGQLMLLDATQQVVIQARAQ